MQMQRGYTAAGHRLERVGVPVFHDSSSYSVTCLTSLSTERPLYLSEPTAGMNTAAHFTAFVFGVIEQGLPRCVRVHILLFAAR